MKLTDAITYKLLVAQKKVRQAVGEIRFAEGDKARKLLAVFVK